MVLVKIVSKAIKNLHAKFETIWCKTVQVMGFCFSGKHRPFLQKFSPLVKQYIRILFHIFARGG